MTDREVSKLNRRDLLELLLETQTENETLQKNCEELKKQLVVLRDALKKSEDALRQNEDELRRAKGVSPPAPTGRQPPCSRRHVKPPTVSPPRNASSMSLRSSCCRSGKNACRNGRIISTVRKCS